MGSVMEKGFSVAKNNWEICKEITTFCFHAEKQGFVKKPLKCVQCGLEIYFVCRVCIDYNKKPIYKEMRGNGVGKQ